MYFSRLTIREITSELRQYVSTKGRPVALSALFGMTSARYAFSEFLAATAKALSNRTQKDSTGGTPHPASLTLRASRLMAWCLCALLTAVFWAGAPNQAQAQVTATCPAMSPGDFSILRPDANTCLLFGADTNPNVAVGNNIGDVFGLGTGGILFGAEPGTGLSNVFYNAGGGDVTIPIVEANPSPPHFALCLKCGLQCDGVFHLLRCGLFFQHLHCRRV